MAPPPAAAAVALADLLSLSQAAAAPPAEDGVDALAAGITWGGVHVMQVGGGARGHLMYTPNF